MKLTEIYCGYGLNKKYIGFCENGNIYKGYGLNKTLIGTYSNSEIYKGYGLNKLYLGSYYEGNIYSKHGLNKTFVGSYNNGDIYKGYGMTKTFVGSYNGYECGAASAAFLLLFEDEDGFCESTTSEEKNNKKAGNDNDTVTGSGNSSGGVGGGIILGFLGLFMLGALPVLFSQYTEYLALFFYNIIPGIILLASIITKLVCKGKFKAGGFILGGLAGAGLMFVAVLVVNAFLHKYDAIQCIDYDMSIIGGFVLAFIAGGNFSNCTK